MSGVAIHLLNPMWDASGGSEWRTLTLFEQLADHADVSIWTEYAPDPSLLGQYPIRDMRATRSFPQGGTLVFVGVYWAIGPWVQHSKPERIVLVYNVIDPETLELQIERLERLTGVAVELVIASPMLAEHTNGRSGVVEYSPIDLERFSPAARSLEGTAAIGRHSRDIPEKHHPEDSELYRTLARDVRVRLLGGTCLESLKSEPGIELLPANSVPPPDFLHGLDVFFYRTDPTWIEGYGRVVAEAMACGLPCVLGNLGGYSTLIRDGENGFLVSDSAGALNRIRELVADSGLRARIGTAARDTVVALYEGQRQKMLDFYLARRSA